MPDYFYVEHHLDGRGNTIRRTKFKDTDEAVDPFLIRQLALGGISRVDLIRAQGGRIVWSREEVG
jgi:hypothetical protein